MYRFYNIKYLIKRLAKTFIFYVIAVNVNLINVYNDIKIIYNIEYFAFRRF